MGGGFSPLSLSPALWLRADLGLFQDAAKTTPAVADADPVGAWADRSGNGRDLLQATASKRPTLKLAFQNGRSALQFDAVDDFLQASFALAGPLTIFVAGKYRNAGSQYTIDGGATGDRVYLLQNGGGADVFAAGPNGLTFAATGPMGVVQLTTVINGASSAVYRDGVQKVTGTQASVTLAGLTLGAKFDGTAASAVDLYEVIAYPSAFATGPQRTVEAYQKAYWGTP